MPIQHLGFATLFVLAVAVGLAAAHVTCVPNQGPRGTYLVTNLQVPHGCGGSPTKGLQVQIGDGITHVKPRRQQGWSLNVTYRDNDATLAAKLGENKTVTNVTWTALTEADYIPDNQFDYFGLSIKLPQNASNDVVYLPAVQVCANSTSAWTDVSSGKDVPQGSLPAPKISLVNATVITASTTTPKNAANHLRIETILFAFFPAAAAVVNL